LFISNWLSPHNITINDGTPVMLKNVDYLIKISKVLSKYEYRPRVLANFLGFNMVYEDMAKMGHPSSLTSRWIKAYEHKSLKIKPNYVEFAPIFKKMKSNEERWKLCTEDVLRFGQFEGPMQLMLLNRGVIGPISSMYVRAYANPNLKPGMLRIVKLIRKEIKKRIEESEWMDKKTKNSALTKLDAMKQLVAFYDELTNKTFMDGFFKGNTNIYPTFLDKKTQFKNGYFTFFLPKQ
jgi:hypothetical protein